MQINILNLFRIIPLSSAFGMLIAAVCAAGKDDKE